MRILIIEDDGLKATKVAAFALHHIADAKIEQRTSYNTGLKAIKSSKFDLCILDMSLPTYDVSPIDEGYETLSYAGELLLGEMRRRKLSIPTVILTQFTTFPEQLGEKSLAELSADLAEKYTENYLGCVFYSDAETSWQSELEEVIKRIRK